MKPSKSKQDNTATKQQPPHRSVEEIKLALASSDDEDLPNHFDISTSQLIIQDRVGTGTFGDVFQVKLPNSDTLYAVKKVMQNRHFRNRELQIMKVLDHPNCVKMKQFFINRDPSTNNSYLNIVMEFVPSTLAHVNKQYVRAGQHVPIDQIRIYSYQLLRACAYIHGFGIVHRDLKPQNVLVNPQTGELKLCDFGSAKAILEGEESICYICSRYYRAPELVFGARFYGTASDLWGIGCIICELILGRPLFPGENNDDQMKKIVQIMGIPTKEDLKDMKAEYRCPYLSVNPITLRKILPANLDPSLLDLVTQLLTYSPSKRPTAFNSLNHPFFDPLSDALPSSPATTESKPPLSSSSAQGSTQKNNDPHTPPFYSAPLFNFTDTEFEMYGANCVNVWSKHKSRFPKPSFPKTTKMRFTLDSAVSSPEPQRKMLKTEKSAPIRPTATKPVAKMKKRSLGISIPSQDPRGKAQPSGDKPRPSPLPVPPNTAVLSQSHPTSPLTPFPQPALLTPIGRTSNAP
ncbi:putative Glycogen synthase kinase-3 beta [Blattamonas nauphoetae]|uniref:Glycogen synthase kinase-3 beta n=1 Tax=Blattamonas nauphoetae TaxID=2049346 RepID=A0ABQ9XUV5_9EUKA|nr:putative Glycogen synthase kinase-3 beta [Blattamonas nauphoetae]